MMRPIVLKGRVIVEGKAKGKALVNAKPMSFLGGVDPADCTIIEKGHDLNGKCIKNRSIAR